MKIDDLKCCGNCVYRECLKNIDLMLEPNAVCQDWEFDGMKNIDRIDWES